VVSRWDLLDLHRQATAKTATAFLEALQARMPFPVRAIQVDGGSQFQADFERECQARGIRLFVLPPRSPKLNGHAERGHPTHAEEFYEVVDSDFTVEDLASPLLRWEEIYNRIRPHQALGYLTPAQWLDKHYQRAKEEPADHRPTASSPSMQSKDTTPSLERRR
jgi:transposase InsO family protein